MANEHHSAGAKKTNREFVSEAYKHCKTIAASGAGVGLLATALVGKFSQSDDVGDGVAVNDGVVTSREGSIKAWRMLLLQPLHYTVIGSVRLDHEPVI